MDSSAGRDLVVGELVSGGECAVITGNLIHHRAQVAHAGWRPRMTVALPRADGRSGQTVGRPRYDRVMAERIWTAEELGRLAPEDRKQVFEASIVRELEQAPPSLVARARDRLEERLRADGP